MHDISKSELDIIRRKLPPNLSDEDCIEYFLKHKEQFTNILDINDKYIDLINIENTRTGKGTLLKYFVKIDGSVYIAKTNNLSYGIFEGYEVESEYIAYRIGEQLGIPICPVRIEKVSILGKETVVSLSKSLLKDDEDLVPIERFLSEKEKSSIDLLNILTTRFPQAEVNLYNMICFDFIINNVDRHLNNFGFTVDYNNNLSLYPLYDNGLSLFADIDDNALSRPFLSIDKSSPSKPFRARQYKQIKLVPKEHLIYLDNLDNISTIIDSIKRYSPVRKAKIKELIKTRNNYVKELKER